MRIEIQLPDSTPASTVAAIQALADRLSARPESVHGLMGVAESQAAYSVAEEIVFHEDGSVTLTAAQLAAVDEAAAAMRRGESFTDSEIDQSLEETRREWQKNQPPA
jgi:hypothetical protein